MPLLNDDIFSDGVFIDDRDQFTNAVMMPDSEHITTLAPLSLRIALDAYLLTHTHLKWQYPEGYIIDCYDKGCKPLYSYEYLHHHAIAIVFFHHAVELEIKEALSKRHPLLASISPKSAALDKLLHGEGLSLDEELGLRSTEFSDALNMFCDLYKLGKLSSDYAFIYNSVTWLRKMSRLRNRLLHKGTYFLSYQALDAFAGRYMLPFALAATNLESWRVLDNLNMYRTLHCGIDPLNMIIEHFKLPQPKIDPVYLMLLKEMAIAANRRPRWVFFEKNADDDFCDYRKDMSERLSVLLRHDDTHEEPNILQCPICGEKALVVKYIADWTEEGEQFWSRSITECACCGFSPNPFQYRNPKHYGLEIPDIWEE